MLKKVKVLHPDYYTEFACSGGSCPDNCCKEWQIVIDKNTYMRYRKVKEPKFAGLVAKGVRRIKGSGASDLRYAEFVLGKNKTCPFFNEDGLCAVQLQFGMSYLSLTCQNYPRRHSQVIDDLSEFSLTLSCPEVMNLLVKKTDSIIFQITEMELPTDYGLLKAGMGRINSQDPEIKPYTELAWQLRESCITVMQSRTHTIAERLLAIGIMLKKVTELKESGDTGEITPTLNRYVLAADANHFKGLIDELKPGDEIRASINSILIPTAFGYAITDSASYRLFKKFIFGYTTHKGGEVNLNFDMSASTEMQEYIDKQAEKHWDAFLKEKSYLLEHYFVSYMFSAIFPLTYSTDKLNPYQHFIILAELYAYMRMLMSCNAGEEGITDQLAAETLASLSSINQHSHTPKRIIEAYNKTELDSLPHISFLLR